jgi:DivIVA domain-containing protein
MLTPEEITSREFLVSLRGYDRDEVHNFLEQVARHVRDLQSHVERLQTGGPGAAPLVASDSIAAPPVPSADTTAFFADLGKSTQRILEAAHEAGSEIQRKARNEADRDLADARNQATKLVAEGQRRREVIEGVVHMLEERRAALADDLRAVSATVEQVLEDLAPRGEMLSPDELLEVAQITAPDETWVPEDEAEVVADDEAVAVPEADEVEEIPAEDTAADDEDLVVELPADEDEAPAEEAEAAEPVTAGKSSGGQAKPAKVERAATGS